MTSNTEHRHVAKATKQALAHEKKAARLQANYDKARARFLEVATEDGKIWLEEMEARVEAAARAELDSAPAPQR